ncbi:telomere length regulation Stn1, partial [Tuber indicum]
MTTTSLAEGLSFYPRFLFPHSLTFNEWARLTVKDIHERLHRRRGFEGQDVWFYSNHPIRWVRVVGIVVAYDDMEKMVSITVDDGSGYLMDLIAWKGKPPIGKKPKFSFDDLENVSLHSIIKAKGSLGEFRGNKQLLLRRIEVLRDTNDEVNAWTETIRFKKDVLSKPWYLTEEFISEEWERRGGSAEEGGGEKRQKDEQTLREKGKELEKARRKKKGKGKVVEESVKGSQV